MTIEELELIFSEIEEADILYQIGKERRKNRIVRNRKKKKVQFAMISLVPILFAGSFHYALFKQKQLHPYSGNELLISSNRKEIIETRMKEITGADCSNSDDIVILNAIYENHHLCDEDKEEAYSLIDVIEDNPYFVKEDCYESLHNVDVEYCDRPDDISSNTMGIYIYPDRDIVIYNEEDEDVLIHELIHCLFMNSRNSLFTRFILEGITQLVTDEYFSSSPYLEYNNYPFEINCVKMLCDIVGSDIVLESYTTGNLDLLYHSMNLINPNVDSEKLISDLDILLKTLQNDSENYSPEEALKIKKQFQTYSNCMIDDSISYSYHLDIFSSLEDKNPLRDYLDKLNRFGVCEKSYFSKKLMNQNQQKVKTYS